MVTSYSILPKPNPVNDNARTVTFAIGGEPDGKLHCVH